MIKQVSLPFLHVYKDRHGRIRRYARKRGRKITLRLDPTDPGFLAEYQRAIDLLDQKVETATPQSWSALVVDYLSSAHFHQLAPRTRAENRREVDRIRMKWGPLPVSRLEPRHILKWQDEMKTFPGRANNMLATLKMLLAFGKTRGYRHNSPADGIRELKSGKYRSWTEGEIGAFEARWPQGTRERLIFDLALYTGQRRSDLLAMTRAHISNGVVGVIQQKTGERVAIPIHPCLQASLDAYPSKGLHLLQRLDGKPLGVRDLSQIFAGAVEAAGLPAACVLHGLRYSAARRLADAGATPHEIMAITGHRTLGMVEKYTREATKDILAKKAIKRLRAGTGTEPEGG